MIYRIDPDTLEVLQSGRYVPEYAPPTPLTDRLSGLFEAVEAEEQTHSCRSNMKQLSLAAMMYAQDWDMHLPQGNWTEELLPYTQNPMIYRCPSRPALSVGFAFNERVLGASIWDLAQPSDTVIMFGSDLGGDAPVGGAAAVPEGGIHDGLVTVGFADGHVKMMAPAELQEMLERDPFK